MSTGAGGRAVAGAARAADVSLAAMEIMLFLPVLIFSIVVHEYAHGWVALRQGDDTAYMLGRLTLNPVPHLDVLGSLIVPVLLWVSQAGFLFGWAKPVPVNPRKFREYRRGDILVSLAGIAANLALAAVSIVLLIVLVHLARVLPGSGELLLLLGRMAEYGLWINLILAFFNLIPIPPLDGSHVLYHLLPPRLGARYREVGRYGILVLFAVMFFVPGIFRLLLAPAIILRQASYAFIGLFT
jgi:Zn-dependent protease